MNSALLTTWTPILKALPQEERERARELIEKYGETYPTSFIVELLQIFGVQGAYLQTIPRQIIHAGDHARNQIDISIASINGLHERSRLELTGIVSHVTRTGAEFGKALEQATQAQMKATADSATAIKAKIQQEFEKQDLPALTACLRQFKDQSLKAVAMAKDTADQVQSLELRCHMTVAELNQFQRKSEWTVCASFFTALLVILGMAMYFGFRTFNERKLAEHIAAASHTIENNRQVFNELALANVTLELNRSMDAQTGKPISSGYAVIIQDAQHAEMRDYKGTKAGFIFVKSPKPEDVIRHLQLRVDDLNRQFDDAKK